jgi:hypothetical protein
MWQAVCRNLSRMIIMRTILLFFAVVLLSVTVVKAQIPHVPVLASPVNDTTGVSINPTLLWHDVSGARNYYLEVSTDSNFSAIVFSDSMLTDTFRIIGPLAPVTVHFWRVNARNQGRISPWSAVWSFTTTSMTFIMQYPVEVPNRIVKQAIVYSLSGRVISKSGTIQYRSMTSGFYIYKTGDQIKKAGSFR